MEINASVSVVTVDMDQVAATLMGPVQKCVNQDSVKLFAKLVSYLIFKD